MKTDLTYLKTMSDNSPELITEMITIFREQVNMFNIEMQKSLDNNDFQSLEELAHKAKTSVSIMGMHELSEQMKELERNSKKKVKVETYQRIISFFILECNEAVKELLDFQSKLS